MVRCRRRPRAGDRKRANLLAGIALDVANCWQTRSITLSLCDSKATYSVSFLPRDAMHKRGLHICRHAVSVYLSITFVSCVKTNKDIFEVFSPSGSQAILVFPCQTWWKYSDGNPLMGAPNARGYEKITICDQYRAISRNWCKIEP